MLLFAAVEVAGHPRLEGRTVGEAFAAGKWRVLGRAAESSGGGAVWGLPSSYVLGAGDRVVLAATRRGLAELLGRGPAGTSSP